MINSNSGVHSPTTELNTLDFLFLVQLLEAVLGFFLVEISRSTGDLVKQNSEAHEGIPAASGQPPQVVAGISLLVLLVRVLINLIIREELSKTAQSPI